MVQEMGRVDRLHTAEVGSNSYNIYLNLNTYLGLWWRVQSEKNASVRDRLNDELQSILRCLIMPQKCYHSMIEEHFENPNQRSMKEGCGEQCSFSKSALIAILTTQVFDKGFVPATSLVSKISSNENKRFKQAIWRTKAAQAQVNAGQVHALVLMLIASKILQLHVPPYSENNALKTIQIGLAKQHSNVGDEFEMISIYIDVNWDGIPHDP